jgi:hypothetical protein
MENPETAATLGTRHRTKTNETKNTTQKRRTSRFSLTFIPNILINSANDKYLSEKCD